MLAHGLTTAPNLILNIMRSSAFYIYEKFGKSYLFSNLAGVQVISMISPPDLPISKGTQVYPKQTFGQERPGIGWGGYFQNLIYLSNKYDSVKRALSEGHKAIIEQAEAKNPNRAINSDDANVIHMQEMLRKSHKPDLNT